MSNIVLNEHDWARDMIERRSLGKKPTETLSRVARYYIDKRYNKRDVRNMLDTFVLQCDPSASLPKWDKLLDFAVNKASKTQAVMIDKIVITKPEINRIDALDGMPIRRLAFTLLVLAKYWNIVSGTSSFWVNSKDTDIMRMANIKASVKRQSQMYHALNEAGLVRFSKKVDNTNVQVLFSEDGTAAVDVCDLRNIGYQYMRYLGGPYFVCQNCGVTEKYDNPEHGKCQKYCRACAIEVRTRQNVNSVMQLRKEKLNKTAKMLEKQNA